MIHEPQESYFSDHSGIDQFAAAIAGLAQPGMSATESIEYFLLSLPETANNAGQLLEEKSHAFGLSNVHALSHALEPLVTHHLREFGGKNILPHA